MARRRKSKRKLVVIGLLVGLLLAGGSAYTVFLDSIVRNRFEGKRFALPGWVYARPLELYPGLKLTVADLTAELSLLRYRWAPDPRKPGCYHVVNQTVELVSRPFVFGDGSQKSLSLQVRFDGGRVTRLMSREGRGPLDLVRLDPALIGGIYPRKNEDRVLVRLDEAPQHLINALIAMEDRRFYSHNGIDPRGIARAIFATATGDGVQGGSTLTQQLVKNFFLTPERTIRRKLTEMVMAVLLEIHYSKPEILETYLNEVYLGHDGNRAIHGFGLAASFFFDKPLNHLTLSEVALLVGMLKGPSYYSPRSHPQRALERRNLVLAAMTGEGFINKQQLLAARQAPLGTIHHPPRGTSPYPAFLSLVHRQLRRNYRDEDLRSEGLRIFTTLDPRLQYRAEGVLSKRLKQLERDRRMAPKTLQGALIVTSTQNAEVQAVVGGRDPRFQGFNRALDARRPIGSLIKPVVYLAALQQPQRYTLATLLDDSPLVYRQAGADDWAPKNYDRKFHGSVSLRSALVNSYNVSTVRLGLDLGISKVMSLLRQLGIERDLPDYASNLLGSTHLSPLEVTQLYQTIAGGGFRTPLRAIREVLTADGKLLQRYPLNVEQVVDPEPLYLLSVALQEVVREGTARRLKDILSPDLDIAGKTGSTDDLRDSWFAGFCGNRLAVVWVGRDDNQPTGLTGASGAMKLWGEMMAVTEPEPLILAVPDHIERAWVDPLSGLRSSAECRNAVLLPFIAGSAPTKPAICEPLSAGRSIKGWFERIFRR
ncbi:MAG: penicillin-binding protein 1B [Syntrophales bacterium]|nr:penicillin-binding protein 1B [Syntrophales bacterium]